MRRPVSDVPCPSNLAGLRVRARSRVRAEVSDSVGRAGGAHALGSRDVAFCPPLCCGARNQCANWSSSLRVPRGAGPQGKRAGRRGSDAQVVSCASEAALMHGARRRFESSRGRTQIPSGAMRDAMTRRYFGPAPTPRALQACLRVQRGLPPRGCLPPVDCPPAVKAANAAYHLEKWPACPSPLGLERAPAAASAGDVRIAELEARSCRGFHVIDLRAVQVLKAERVHEELDPV